jgi:hypothetical protein
LAVRLNGGVSRSQYVLRLDRDERAGQNLYRALCTSVQSWWEYSSLVLVQKPSDLIASASISHSWLVLPAQRFCFLSTKVLAWRTCEFRCCLKPKKLSGLIWQHFWQHISPFSVFRYVIGFENVAKMLSAKATAARENPVMAYSDAFG